MYFVRVRKQLDHMSTTIMQGNVQDKKSFNFTSSQATKEINLKERQIASHTPIDIDYVRGVSDLFSVHEEHELKTNKLTNESYYTIL